jgi:hypothetical protein
MLAETLLKVVQANVAREARGVVKHHFNQESFMDNETTAPSNSPAVPMASSAPAPEAAPTPTPAATQVATAVSAIDARLQNVANLVQTLSTNPDIKSLLCSLLEVPVQNQTPRD